MVTDCSPVAIVKVPKLVVQASAESPQYRVIELILEAVTASIVIATFEIASLIAA